MRKNIFFFLFLLLLPITCLIILGCSGGGSDATGVGGLNTVGPVEEGPIVQRLNFFAKDLAEGNLIAAQSHFSPTFRSNSSGQLQSLAVYDFGRKIGSSTDNTLFLFEIAPGGITQLSTVDATVKANFIMNDSTRIVLVFQMIKHYGDWLIDDIKVTISSGESFPASTFFPIQSGDYWKFQISDSRIGEIRDFTITVSSESRVIDGKRVVYLECSSAVRQSVGVSSRASILNPGGINRLTWGFSNDGGLWNYGALSDSSYSFNDGKPLKILDEQFRAGDIATWTVSEKFGNLVYTKQIVIQVKQPVLINSVFGSVKALTIRFVWHYLNGMSPDGVLAGGEEWYLRENFGLIGFMEFDPDSGESLTKSECVDVKIDGVVQNQVAMVLMKTTLPESISGQSYSNPFTVIGGVPPFSFRIASGTLPDGITLLDSGVLSGIPLSGGKYNISINVTDSSGLSDYEDFELSVIPMKISCVLPLTAFLSESWNQKLTVVGGVQPVTWKISSGALPTGLKIVQPDIISGIITATGTFEFTLKASDANSFAVEKEYTVQVSDDLVITAEIPSSVTVNSLINGKYISSGGNPPYFYSIQEGTLPKGVVLSNAGVLSGIPVESGIFNFVVRVLDSKDRTAQTTSILKVQSPEENSLIISTSSIAQQTNIFASFTASLSASGAAGGLHWEKLSGNIPPGMTLLPNGSLTGVPTSVGSYSFVVKATDSLGKSGTAEIKLNVVNDLNVIASIPTTGQVNSSFSGSFNASGGFPPYLFHISSGNLPSGLALSADGKISGTLTAEGNYTFSVTVTDSKGLLAINNASVQVIPANPAPVPNPDPVPEATFSIVISSVIPTANLCATYSANLQFLNGSAPISSTISSGSLPDGITLSDNCLSGIPITSGTYFFEIIASDTLGKIATATFSIQVSNSTNPNPPIISIAATLSNTPENPTNQTTASITVGGIDVVKYSYSLNDGTWSPETPISTILNLTNLTSSEHYLEVIGIDALGNMQSKESATTFTWTIDTTAKVAVLSNKPANPTNIASTAITVGGTGVVKYSYSLDNGTWSPETPISTVVNLSSLASGEHSLKVIGIDAIGNIQSKESATTFTWTIDTAAKVAVLNNKPANPTNQTSVSIAVGGTGVVKYSYSLDNSTWSPEIPVSTPLDLSGLSSSEHSLKVIGIDALGNIQSKESSTSFIWTIDTAAKLAVLSNMPSNITKQTSVEISVGGTGVVRYSYSLDNGTWSAEIPVSTLLSLTNLAHGNHKLLVLGIDELNNWQSQSNPTNFEWKIDTVQPAVVLSDDHDDSIVCDSDMVTITGTFADTDEIDEVNPPTISIGNIITGAAMDKTDNLHWTYVWNVPTANNGNHAVSVNAKDRSGNSCTAATGRILYTIDNNLPASPIINANAINENLSGRGNKKDTINTKLKSDFSNFKVNIANTNPGNKAGTLFIKLTDSALPSHSYTTSGEAISENAPAADIGKFSPNALNNFADGDLNIEAWIIDAVGNESNHTIVKKTSALSTTPPVVTAPTNIPQKLKKGDVSTSTVRSSKPGNIYLIRKGETAIIQAEIDVAIASWKAFLGKADASPNVPYTIVIPPDLLSGVYDIIAVDDVGNVSSTANGWLTVDGDVF
ncbi:MAG: putative Ig domain-containing protein [Candidatus Riflebacteria bacterium]|nr:putative Ig domain-containing protein [Candidatus Riflebacteria bacterium]